MRLRLFTAVDSAAHWLHERRLLPRQAKAWVCDRYERWLEVEPGEMHRSATTT